MKRETSDAQRMKPRGLRFIGVVLLVFVVGLTACSNDIGEAIGEAIDFVEYIGATGDVLEANGSKGSSPFDMDCDGSTETKTVTCTAETSAGQSIESIGENLGEDNATLVVTVDGQVIYDGLLTGVPGS
ncbi:MAG: hypothetical protein DRJ28_09830 [Actinobacteria bacterium]|nr:MAG: hypothetical protein DRJ28_09830 [Actinomycetota bacterium]